MTSRKLRTEHAYWSTAAGAFVAAVVTVVVAGLSFSNTPQVDVAVAARLPRPQVRPRASVAVVPSVSTVVPVVRADERLDRSGYTLVGSGALFIPSSFHSADGRFDLLVHFHGNAELVAQSVAEAKLDVVVLVINVGIGSGAYESRYITPAIFDYDLTRVVEVVTARGLRDARIGRLALSAWSAGYGSLLRLLAREDVVSRTSAVLLADALHSNFSDERTRQVDMERIAPIVRFAKHASAGDKLFVMTHSEVNEFRYATTTETSTALIDAVGAYRSRTADWPDRPSFALARSVMSHERWLEQSSEAAKGLFLIRGYRGYREDDHIAHLAQMSSTVLAELARYWSPKKR